MISHATHPGLSLRDYVSLIKQECHIYYRLELVDIYKLAFQAFSGPAHMAGSQETIRTNIYQELEQIGHKNAILWQDIGLGRGFARIGLYDLQRDFHEDRIDLLAAAIIASRLPDGIDWDAWRSTWSRIASFLQNFYPLRELDKIWNAYLLPCATPSHSETYKYLNKPHYRIVRIEYSPQFYGKEPIPKVLIQEHK